MGKSASAVLANNSIAKTALAKNLSANRVRNNGFAARKDDEASIELHAVQSAQAVQTAQNAHEQQARFAKPTEVHDARDEAASAQSAANVVSRAAFVGDADADEDKDHFIVRNGVVCAGTHLIIDLYDANHLDDLQRMEGAFIDAVQAAGATLLHIHMHHFTPNGGISGVAVLAESHISVHTWPERRYAAFDVFMCGNARPELAVEVLKERFRPGRIQVSEILRGTTSE